MSAPSRSDRAKAIRFLSMDAVQVANSGHPGMPMGMADIAEVLWHDFLKHNPSNPKWSNRDRFVLSNGHGSMLLYSLLHLTGYPLTIEDLKQFRQLHSKTPGHPEFGEAEGVETTTGPLGQGIANAVGMAIAEQHLAAVFNRENYPIVDHFTYVFVGDGDLMEGISHEVCSLAGALGLGKLIVFYDDNGISIDGDVTNWFQDNTPRRFEAYHWHVVPEVNGHDPEAIKQAILEAQSVRDKPTIICCKTTIGWGSPNLAGKASTHGAALGHAEIDLVRNHLEWEHTPFEIPEKIYQSWNAQDAGQKKEAEWIEMFKRYEADYPALSKEFQRRMQHALPIDFNKVAQSLIDELNTKKQNIATRKASQQCLDILAHHLPELLGGSADLTESNCTNWKGMSTYSKQNPEGRYIHYGVREFGMSAIMNGFALYGGIIPFGGTFLTFSDYARNALRLASIMKQRVIFIYSHDSIGLGEDGPTHQPVEQLPGLRLMPNMSIWRPCDSVETGVAWEQAIIQAGPTCLLLSRQNLAHQERNKEQLENIRKGGYILLDPVNKKVPDAILIATGSEVELAVEAALTLAKEDIHVRVVSMPSTDHFLAESKTYQDEVLPPNIKARVAIEAAASNYWYQFVGESGQIVGLDRFGASAPYKDVYKDCGFTVSRVVTITKEVIYSAARSQDREKPKYASGQ